ALKRFHHRMGDSGRQPALAMSRKMAGQVGLVNGDQALKGIETQGIQGGIELDVALKPLRIAELQFLQPAGQALADVEALQLITVDSGNDGDLGPGSALKNRPLENQAL